MPVSTDTMHFMLLNNDKEPNSFVFSINCSIDDIALALVRLPELDGVSDLLRFVNLDHEQKPGERLTVFTVILEPGIDYPAVFGRMAMILATELGVGYNNVLIYRTTHAGTQLVDAISYMVLTHYLEKFPTSLDGHLSLGDRDDRILTEMEAALR